MVEQLLIAYCIGMVVAIVLEGGRILKARRINRGATRHNPVAPAGAPAWRSDQSVSHNATPAAAANETAVMKVAG